MIARCGSHSGEHLKCTRRQFPRLSHTGFTASPRSASVIAAGVFTQFHLSEREISDEEIIFGLFFKGRFQFILSLRPTLVPHRNDRPQFPVPSQAKSAVRLCHHPALHQAGEHFS